MSSVARHWVEDLFPPTYGLTIQDIVDDKSLLKTSEPDQEHDVSAAKEPSVFEKISQKISPLDTSAIKNVYERVWFMQNLETLKEGEPYDALLRRGASQENGNTRDASTSTSDLVENLDIRNSCVWTDSEIDVLRSLFKTAQCQSRELEAKLQAVNIEIEKQKQKIKSLSKLYDEKTCDYAKAATANERLAISVKFLKIEQHKSEERITAQNKTIKKFHQQRQENGKDLQRLLQEVDALRLQNQKLETDLALHKQEALREQILREDDMKTAHEKNVGDLITEISRLKEELKQEKNSHSKTKKGLDHLRTHFSSLPIFDPNNASTGSASDRLTKWTY